MNLGNIARLFIWTGFGNFVIAILLTFLLLGDDDDYHPASFGSAEGFALSGGLCFVAAALVLKGSVATANTKVKCGSCAALVDSTAKHCPMCGKAIP